MRTVLLLCAAVLVAASAFNESAFAEFFAERDRTPLGVDHEERQFDWDAFNAWQLRLHGLERELREAIAMMEEEEEHRIAEEKGWLTCSAPRVPIINIRLPLTTREGHFVNQVVVADIDKPCTVEFPRVDWHGPGELLGMHCVALHWCAIVDVIREHWRDEPHMFYIVLDEC